MILISNLSLEGRLLNLYTLLTIFEVYKKQRQYSLEILNYIFLSKSQQNFLRIEHSVCFVKIPSIIGFFVTITPLFNVTLLLLLIVSLYSSSKIIIIIIIFLNKCMMNSFIFINK